jgi:YHS domain-containing protein
MLLAGACGGRPAELVPPIGEPTVLDPAAAFPKIRFADDSVSVNDRCPVTKRKLSPLFPPVYVNGSPIGFCWRPCVKVFVQDPQIQLLDLGLAVPDVLDPRKLAVLDAAHRSFVDYETYFFLNEDDKRRFDADPTASCGILTDPVTKARFRPGSDSPRLSFDGRAYIFFSEASRQAFEKTPEAYARPNYDHIAVPGMPWADRYLVSKR